MTGNNTLGDLAQSYMLRNRNTALKQDITRLTQELASGQVADVRQVLSGNFSYLTDLERKMDILSGYEISTTEATHFTTAMQAALGQMGDISKDLSGSLITAGTSGIGVSAADLSNEAENALEALIGRLNTNISGRHMFSGAATDRPALADAQTLLTELKTAMAGAVTPADMITAAQIWFDDPAGFDAVIYQGSNIGLSPFDLSQAEVVNLDLRATDDDLKDTVMLTALAALGNDPAFALTPPAQSELFLDLGQRMLAAQDSLTSLQANVGFVEARIDAIATRNAAETTSLSFAKAALLEVDPFEAATKLEDVQFQLQSLYSVTVRMSQLSLVNFL
ncbi:flagellar hook protein [Sulfitobacter mediterraneus]|uniref:flagellin n=1 Tax=Sulfitobacter mediterraneus TaxID=83219 RepID=UPI0019324690|nr:flagellin [Sulfitobacter mediterraneus]MBM1308797.1 flagellar hook protein [Sulfitobacter mediterraneus]MBM1312682.1 flagellar hook protein [Sulfitobacter mediterraneus]MBM1321064.1 flagellar hook protein [Sulfitobacter mediterraneus]MBM1324951.1 flagellar hook protein [Sulfitobacter mediterraneus]MBM1396298.1 flagellar hook protein [Sulfitobacter mediterraneus]